MSKIETVLFGGGCFWCTEAVFKMIEGVTSVVPGYAGGHTNHPTYEDVSIGTTGHAEVVKIVYDSSKVKFKDLLTIFFASHDPTTMNKQGNDIGTQYRSVIFCNTEQQKIEALNFIESINLSNNDGDPVVTEVLSLPVFYDAETYHHDYYARNKNQGYCQIIINPKLEKVQKEFAHLLKSL